MKNLIPALLILLFSQSASAIVSPTYIGWGNTLIPGMGATLRGEPGRGMAEAGTEIGLYYGGTFFGKEGEFTIDNSVLVSETGVRTWRPVIGGMMQEVGLKLHMYNTFYHYQQADLDPQNAEIDKRYSQPIYKGAWNDVLLAPFKLKNLESWMIWGPLLGQIGYECIKFNKPPVAKSSYHSRELEESFYAAETVGIEPLGSAFGEEAFFRGFLQREFTYYTDSPVASIVMQGALFALIHPKPIQTFSIPGGLYYGFLTHHFDGNIEQAIAHHFWADLIHGTANYLLYRKSQDKSDSFGLKLEIPFYF